MKTRIRLNSGWQLWLGMVGGVGFLPVAPGTWGAAAGILLLLPFLGVNPLLFLPFLLFITLILSYLGAIAARDLAPEWGEDPKSFVLDEVVGVWVAVMGHALDIPHLLAAFVLFRIFDIFKPFGIRRFEAVPNGWGVMLDDLAAGIVSNVVLWALIFLTSGLKISL